MVHKNLDKYQWILFDADGTLFSFDDKAGLGKLLSEYNIQSSDADYRSYQLKNKSLWRQYQDGIITATELQSQRFEMWSKILSVPASQLNDEFLQAMSFASKPLTGALQLVSRLYGVVKMGIITNGFNALQSERLIRAGMDNYFEFVVVSESVGAAKPQKRIFDAALQAMGEVSVQAVLMVGDNLVADIGGGNQMGFDTCWIKNDNYKDHKGIKPTMTIDQIADLESILFSSPHVDQTISHEQFI